MTEIVPITPDQQVVPLDLDELARDINVIHERNLMRALAYLEEAIKAGHLLSRAQERCQEEDIPWRWWLERNIRFNYSTVQDWMRAARNEKEIKAAGAQSLTDAMRLLQGRTRHLRGPIRYSDEQVEEMVECARTMGYKPAAKHLGVSVGTVHRLAAPRLDPRRQKQSGIRIDDQTVERVAAWLISHCPRHYGPVSNVKTRGDARRLLEHAAGIDVEAVT